MLYGSSAVSDPAAVPEFGSSSASTSGSDDASRFEREAQRYLAESGKLNEEQLVSIEAGLVKLVCKILAEHGPAPILRPSLSDWLKLIGLTASNVRQLELYGVNSILNLLAKSDKEIRSLSERGRFSLDLKRRLIRSTEALRLCMSMQKEPDESSIDEKRLSWSLQSPISSRSNSVSIRSSTEESCSRPSTVEALSQRGSVDDDRSSCSLSVMSRRGQTLSPSSPISSSAQSTPLLGSNRFAGVVHSSSMQFTPNSAPKSPKASRLVHEIPHSWRRIAKFRITDSVCNFCQRPLGFSFFTSWEKCRSCKWKVHSHCKHRIGDTCGLTPDHLRALFDKLVQQNNGDMWSDPQSAVPISRSLNEPAFQYPDTTGLGMGDSSSSTNSSAPSTPALPLGLAVNSPYNLSTAPSRSVDRKFLFPDAVPELPDIVLPESSEFSASTGDERSETSRLYEGSEGTLVVDSTGSADLSTSDGARSPGLSSGHQWDRNRWNMSTIRGPNTQASWNEVTIPFDKIDFNRNPLIGKGRFGEVMRGYHFGDVAVKLLNMDHIAEDKRFEEFKAEVAAHKNTRHDNIVLFLGFSLDSDKLGIVMSFCKGRSLHSLVHEAAIDKLDLLTALQIATQICQGVSYLHTKKILHKDLRSKNIFVESKNKVVITDFGLFSMKRLAVPHRDNGVVVSDHWLCYLAPEVMRALHQDLHEPPFTESSDVFAFGTVWYELLMLSFPFDRMLPDQIVWMVGTGLKAPLHSSIEIKEVKDLLSRCWSFNARDRPSFGDVLCLLNAFPRKRLDRSPSFPAIRSFESIF